MRIKCGSRTACLTVGLAIAIAVSIDGGAVSVAKDASPPAKRGNSAAKTLTRAQKLRRALAACKKEKSKSKRTACERKARGRYGPTSKKPETNGPTAQEEERTGKTKEEERTGSTKVTLECPATAVVEKPIPIGGTGTPGAAVTISYTTPLSGGSQALTIDNSGHYTSQITAQQAGTYTFSASSNGVTSPQCTTQAM